MQAYGILTSMQHVALSAHANSLLCLLVWRMLLLLCPEDSHELGGFNPSFLWLLRDFYFDMIEEGRKVRPGMYSSQACTQWSNNSSSTQDCRHGVGTWR